MEVAMGPTAVPSALGAQVEGVDVPEEDRQKQVQNHQRKAIFGELVLQHVAHFGC